MRALLEKELQSLKNPEKIEIYQRFFKTGKGEYGEGDVFLGITVPTQRNVAKNYYELSLKEIKELLKSNIHEYRFTALVILVHQFKQGDENKRKKIYEFYIKNAKRINNWDLVDTSAPKIVGQYLVDKDKSNLYKLCTSKNLWEKRIAMLATYAFIQNKEFDDIIKLSKIYLNEKHDLMHKAVGWMLREAGKKDEKVLTNFLEKYSKVMPRTMLRYSIERLTKKQKEKYMKK
jgi:3-methyladenine DNA glycosylase AlkD